MSDLSLNEAFRMVAEKKTTTKTTPDRAFERAVKALLESLWRLDPNQAEYKASEATCFGKYKPNLSGKT
jgi:hypothetical protein